MLCANDNMSEKPSKGRRFSIYLNENILKKLEEKRGFVNRSKYIREVLKDWWERELTLDDIKQKEE